MSTFKIAVIGIFIFFAVVGVFVFAGFGSNSASANPEITLWGTLPAQQIGELVHTLNSASTVINLKYTQKSPEDFHNDFANALAEGRGPDAVLLPDDLLYQEHNKLIPIGFQTYPERDYRDTFIDAADLFVSKTGIWGVPFAVDPMVMYWNKDIFSSAAIASPPALWSKLSEIGPSIIQRNNTLTILRALVPLGEFRNITNAKGILATLAFQSGNPIDVEGEDGYVSTVDVGRGSATSLDPALSFFTSFSNPVKPLYTWNRSLPESRDAFLAGDLAMYLGYSSELLALRAKNPNLNFDVATMPQADNAPKATSGHVYALSIIKNTPHVDAVLASFSMLTSANTLGIWTKITNLPPVRRDLLTTRPTDPYLDIFYSAAIQTKTWMDPNPVLTDQIFQDMVESITTGRGKLTDAVSLGKQKLDQLYVQGR